MALTRFTGKSCTTNITVKKKLKQLIAWHTYKNNCEKMESMYTIFCIISQKR